MKIFDKLAVKAKCAAKKMNGDSQLIVVLVLIIIAIALCIIFQDAISKLMTKIFNSVATKVDTMTNFDAGKITIK